MRIREYTVYNEQEVLRLYSAVGWVAYTRDPDALKRGFSGSLLVLAAYEGEELVGILRAVGDGATIVFIQDIIVSPQWQRQGVGTALVRELIARFPGVRQIELAADDDPKLAAFYSSLGFGEFSSLGCRGFMRIGH